MVTDFGHWYRSIAFSSMILQTVIFSSESSDFLKQIITLKSINFVLFMVLEYFNHLTVMSIGLKSKLLFDVMMSCSRC